MKTTLEIEEQLYRAVKAKAAQEGKRVTDLVEEGLRLCLERREKPIVRVEVPILKATEPAHKISWEELKKAEEDLEHEEAMRIAQFIRR
jgi:hypothetical protein